jgi:phosphate transport system substrate-binding protein
MKSLFLIGFAAVLALPLKAQSDLVQSKADARNAEVTSGKSAGQKVVIVTGARFSYKLVQRWIDDYYKVSPETQIIIDSRGSSDPAKYDVLAEVYQQDDAVRETREYVQMGRYAILPVANAKSQFAATYVKKGLNTELIKQLYFHNIFADKNEQQEIKAPFTVYTRLQKAGVPIVFTRYFGFDQKEINGKAIAGSDEHLLKALLRDSTGISYLPLPLIFDQVSRKVIDGLVVLPVDLDGNGKVAEDEKIYGTLDQFISAAETRSSKELKNVPVEYLHLSVDGKTASPEAVAFLKWVSDNGKRYLNEFGYLKPEDGTTSNEKFAAFASKRVN